MPSDKITARAGDVTVEVDMREINALADRLTQGAVTDFLKAAHKHADPIVADAKTDRALWPRRTGESQDATRIEERIGVDFVELVAQNAAPHTFRLRYSIRTADSMDSEARAFAAATWGNLGEAVNRAGDVTKKGKHAGKAGAKRRTASALMLAASKSEWGSWWGSTTPTQEAIRQRFRGNLAGKHGAGAPNEKLAGKHVWSTRVRRPMKKAEPALAADAQDALDRLAGG